MKIAKTHFLLVCMIYSITLRFLSHQVALSWSYDPPDYMVLLDLASEFKKATSQQLDLLLACSTPAFANKSFAPVPFTA